MDTNKRSDKCGNDSNCGIEGGQRSDPARQKFVSIRVHSWIQPVHRPARRNPGNATAATVTARNVMLTTALSLKKAALIHFRLRLRASQCSTKRQPRMKIRPAKY